MRKMVGMLALMLGGCAAGAQTPVAPLTLAAIGDAELAAIESGLRASMKDARSAQFGGMSAGRDANGTTHVCGTVNGKNSLGGYTGFQPYVGILAEVGEGERRTFVFAPAGFGSDAIADRVVRDKCRALGLAV